MVEEPTATAINIRADYVAKNGAPSAAAPKIFFRYYYVNSSTGEKSGVMLAVHYFELFGFKRTYSRSPSAFV